MTTRGMNYDRGIRFEADGQPDTHTVSDCEPGWKCGTGSRDEKCGTAVLRKKSPDDSGRQRESKRISGDLCGKTAVICRISGRSCDGSDPACGTGGVQSFVEGAADRSAPGMEDGKNRLSATCNEHQKNGFDDASAALAEHRCYDERG